MLVQKVGLLQASQQKLKEMTSLNKRNISRVLILCGCIWTLTFLFQNYHESYKTSNTEVTDSSVSKNGYWVGLGAANQHVFDSSLSTALIKVFKDKQASTILELGAGMGMYSEKFMLEGFHVSCYDGNPNTQELSKGRCAVLDLSKPIKLSQSDWVLSLEVGEHIPRQFEEIFLDNLDSGNIHGMIISWAVEGQGGHSHVNCRNNSYIKEAIEMRGYSQDLSTQKFLRTSAHYAWFKNTIMVFTRKQS